MKNFTKLFLAACLLAVFAFSVNAQSVGINSTGDAPNSSAILDVSSTTQGFLLPRMTSDQLKAIPTPSNGLMVICTDCGTGVFAIYLNGLWSYFTSSVLIPPTPTASTHTPSKTQIIWNWNSSTGATGYKWNATDNYATATDLGNVTTYTETGLTCETSYIRYIWAYNEMTHSASVLLNQSTSACWICGDNFVDSRDSKTYTSVLIGAQCWMAKNLAYLPSVVGPGTGDGTALYYYVYDYDGTDVATAKATSNYQTYGVLYNWPSSLTACPTGWHLPTDAEWTTLTTYLGGENVAGGKLKEAGTSHWITPNTGADNSSGFTALPGGRRYTGGTFNAVGSWGYWWSSYGSSIYAGLRLMYYENGNVGSTAYNKSNGFSVRCLKD